MTKTQLFIVWLMVSLPGLYACKQGEKTQIIFEPVLELTAQPGGFVRLDSVQGIHVLTTLFNPTNDTISFVTMSCSYEDMFITNKDTFKIQSRYNCYSNYPVTFNIPPHSKLDQLIMIRPMVKDVQLINSKLRIGMYYLSSKKPGALDVIREHETRQQTPVLWSNELDLQRFYRKVYQ